MTGQDTNGLVVYAMEGCPFCMKAKGFLAEKGYSYTEIPVEPGSDSWEAMKRISGSEYTPQILVNGEPIGGYADLVNLYTTGELDSRLGIAADGPQKELFDVIIIGGGPAGLNAALYAARKVLKTLMITTDIGGQLRDTWEIDNYLGYSGQAFELIEKFQSHVEKYDIQKRVGLRIASLDLTGRIKAVTTEEGEVFYTRTVILAMGKRPRKLNVPGEADLLGKGVAYCSTCDAPFYTDANVAVIGGGNSALEAVIDLDKVARQVYMVSITELTGDPMLQNRVRTFSKVKLYTRYALTRIYGTDGVAGVEIESLDSGEQLRLDVEGVFVEIGLLSNSDLIIGTLMTNQMGEIVVDSVCRTGIPGVFACGDVTSVPFKQVTIAAGEGAKAALAAYDYLLTER